MSMPTARTDKGSRSACSTSGSSSWACSAVQAPAAAYSTQSPRGALLSNGSRNCSIGSLVAAEAPGLSAPPPAHIDHPSPALSRPHGLSFFMPIALSVHVEHWPIAGAFAIARGAKAQAQVVVAELAHGRCRGSGECVPYARYGETVEGVAAAIEAM